ncbi:MAG: hypothetical protein LBQ35_06505 [Spirochaetaceae bacterium]|jgi:hypothetical protein|nr:hypothetical protein [Spirochaetaceae bacterium]
MRALSEFGRIPGKAGDRAIRCNLYCPGRGNKGFPLLSLARRPIGNAIRGKERRRGILTTDYTKEEKTKNFTRRHTKEDKTKRILTTKIHEEHKEEKAKNFTRRRTKEDKTKRILTTKIHEEHKEEKRGGPLLPFSPLCSLCPLWLNSSLFMFVAHVKMRAGLNSYPGVYALAGGIMQAKRIIPCLDVDDGKEDKTKRILTTKIHEEHKEEKRGVDLFFPFLLCVLCALCG